MSLSATPASPREARRFVRARVGQLGFHRIIDDVALVVTELVTNALIHVESPSQVGVYLRHGRIRLEVSDDSPMLPVRQRFSVQAGTGRGLAVVESLCAAWGATPSPHGGKVVWADFDLTVDRSRPRPA